MRTTYLIIGSATSALGTTALTATLGRSNDTLFMNDKLSSANTLDGGTDTLAVSKALSAADLSNVTSFDVARYSITGTVTQDAMLTGRLNDEVRGAATLTLTGLANNSTVAVTGTTAGFALTLGANTAADNLTGAGAFSSLPEVIDLDTLNIVSTGGANLITADLVTARWVCWI